MLEHRPTIRRHALADLPAVLLAFGVACFTTCCTAELEDAVAGVEIPTAAITAAMVPATAAIAAFMTEVPFEVFGLDSLGGTPST